MRSNFFTKFSNSTHIFKMKLINLPFLRLTKAVDSTKRSQVILSEALN